MHRHRRAHVQAPPHRGLEAPLEHVDVGAAQVLELLGDDPRHVGHAVVVPADARLAHPALDAGDVVTQLGVDLGVHGGAGGGVHG
ncbi:MAG: hypothetical protein P1P87_01080 [Trueperaceae bacterium]|nr:hypothetical protein [Trueperaceae bacterium]